MPRPRRELQQGSGFGGVDGGNRAKHAGARRRGFWTSEAWWMVCGFVWVAPTALGCSLQDFAYLQSSHHGGSRAGDSSVPSAGAGGTPSGSRLSDAGSVPTDARTDTAPGTGGQSPFRAILDSSVDNVETDGSSETPDGDKTDASNASDGCALCSLRSALVHRYRFDGTGSPIDDSVGAAHGIAVGAQVAGTGTLVLRADLTEQYADLPNGILSTLRSATLEVWVTWDGGDNYQRIFDFGDNSGGEGSRGTGKSYVFLSPAYSAQGAVRLRASYRSSLQLNSVSVAAPDVLPTGTLVQVAMVLNDTERSLSLYLNGTLQGKETGIQPLSEIKDVNCWLGRSQYLSDPQFTGTLHDFRIYGLALSAAQIKASYVAGPDSALDT